MSAASAPEVARLHGLELADEQISARLALNGDNHLLTYRVVGMEPDERYEPFVVAATPIAMRAGLPLSVPSPVSPRLLRGLPTAQEILHAWFGELRPIDVEAPGLEAPTKSDGRGVACFFSGGVDSFYSVLRHRHRLDALIHVHGFDVPLNHRRRRALVSKTMRRAAEDLELPLIEVETDLRAASNRYVLWGTQFNGAGLASVALLTSPRFREVLIPASHSYRDLFPWGSHPMLDHLWSTESVDVVHDAPLPRPEKVRGIADSDVAMRHLRVCFHHDAPGLNCGQCEKCLRTMAALRAAGALERCATFASDLPLRRLVRTPVRDTNALVFTRENLVAAEAAGDDELARAIRRMIRFGGWRRRLARGREETISTLRRRRRKLRRRGRKLGRRARRLRRSARRVARATRAAARLTGRR